MGRTGRPGAACSLSPVQQPAAASCGPQTQSLSLLRTPKHHAARFLHATALWSVLNAEHAQQAANANAAPTNATKSNHTPSLRARGGCCRPDSASSSAAAAAAAASAYAEAAACGCPGGTVMGTTGRTGATCALNLFKTVKSEGRSAFDLIEKEAAYQLVVNAPGLDARDIMIDLDDQVLTISGKKQPATEEAQQQQPQQQADKWEVVPSSSSIGEDEDEDGKVEDADDVSDTKTKTGHESPATSSAAATPTTSPRAATAPAAAAAAATAAASLTKSSDVRVLFSKRRQPSFVRALKLPGNVVAIGISASLECGVLTVTVPKTPEKPKPPPMRIKMLQHAGAHGAAAPTLTPPLPPTQRLQHAGALGHAGSGAASLVVTTVATTVLSWARQAGQAPRALSLQRSSQLRQAVAHRHSRSPSRAPPSTMPLVFWAQPAVWSARNAKHAQQAANANINAAPADVAKPKHMPSMPARGGCCRPDSASASAAAAAASAYAEAAACGCPGGAVMGTTGRTGATCALDLFKTVKSEGRSAFDWIEKEAAYELVVNAPGLDARNITIDLEGQVLTISGKKQPATEEAPDEEQQQQQQEQQKPQRQADKWEMVPNSSSGEDEDGKVEDADDASDTKAKTGHESPATSSAAATPATSPRAAAAPAAVAAAAIAAAPLTKSSDVRVVFSERRQPSFARAFKLPGNVVASSISASLDRGVLTVTVLKMPERPKPQPTRIKVQMVA
ncbi:hypothetical protein FOA52_012768 [Chlamydomonas sp. UWO 241]|nr:hypothetical protein FOA52_012768 [Chlamydomonas sp. UWO 241]